MKKNSVESNQGKIASKRPARDECDVFFSQGMNVMFMLMIGNWTVRIKLN
jgi:hypothetical protein